MVGVDKVQGGKRVNWVLCKDDERVNKVQESRKQMVNITYFMKPK